MGAMQVEQAHAKNLAWNVGTVPIASPHASGAEITSRGEVIVSLADNVARGGRILWTPTDNGGQLEWKCTGEAIQARYLPRECRG